MRDSVLAGRPTSPTRCSPRCGSSSAATSKRDPTTARPRKARTNTMTIEILNDPPAVAARAASIIADAAWDAIAERGTFVMAVSGGETPRLMLNALADAHIPWRAVQIVQVDERVAPA